MKNKIVIADHFYLRLKGLMLIKNCNYFLYLPQCNSIHTFMMRFKIDVLILDQNNKIIDIIYNLNKNKIVTIKRKKKMTSILEIPSQINHHYKINDLIILE